MDYGQPAKTDDKQPFFTAGIGTNAENANNFATENNLDLTNEQAGWQTTSGHSAREMGNLAISQPEAETSPLPNNTSESLSQPESANIIDITKLPGFNPQVDPVQEAAEAQGLSKNQELGNIIDLEMPPEPKPRATSPQESSLDLSSTQIAEEIKSTESLSQAGIKAVDEAVNKLNQDGNIADFYETAREMMEINLENSYGENAAWKGNRAGAATSTNDGNSGLEKKAA